LPNFIWEAIVDLHKRLLTAIPRSRRSFWLEKVNEFYKNNFTNIKPK
jgi:G:T-mismatch repair DNA endonuclease (very short patch repair protein)